MVKSERLLSSQYKELTATDLLRCFEGVNTGTTPPLPCSLDDYIAGTCSLEEMYDSMREQNGEGIACFLLSSGEMDVCNTFNVCRGDTTMARQDNGFDPSMTMHTVMVVRKCMVYPPYRAGTHSWNAMPATCCEVATFVVQYLHPTPRNTVCQNTSFQISW